MSVFYKKEMFPDGKSPDGIKRFEVFSRVDGGYVGDENFAAILENLGICPQRASLRHKVCSIGYNHFEEKWYGWSHRAMHGFGIGSTVSRGDCAYVPVDMEDARKQAIRFWEQDSRLNVDAVTTVDDEGRTCFEVTWTNSADPKLIPNEEMRGQDGYCHSYPPEQFGRGEWTAETMEDAKQMAIDFAEGVG